MRSLRRVAAIYRMEKKCYDVNSARNVTNQPLRQKFTGWIID